MNLPALTVSDQACLCCYNVTEHVQDAVHTAELSAMRRSVFYLPKPLALNYLVAEKFGGPTLVLQGAKDPLNNAKGRAAALKAACPNIQVHLLDGGHCPVRAMMHKPLCGICSVHVPALVSVVACTTDHRDAALDYHQGDQPFMWQHLRACVCECSMTKFRKPSMRHCCHSSSS